MTKPNSRNARCWCWIASGNARRGRGGGGEYGYGCGVVLPPLCRIAPLLDVVHLPRARWPLRVHGARCPPLLVGASIGQVWTRHLAPAAPASRPSLPTQFHDCSCHADSALQFVPSLLPGWGKSRTASTGFRALSPLD